MKMNVWPMKPLEEICALFADGDWIESKDQSSSGIRLTQTGNVGEGVFKDREAKARYISEATFKRLRCTEIVEGDCLISRLPDPVGRSCILPDTGNRMITAVDCTIVRFDTNQMLPEFFNFFTQSLDYLNTLDAETSGTTRKRISRSKLGQALIPLPPLPEQRRIVGILDEAFAGIATAKANAEKNLSNARDLFASYVQSIFTRGDSGWISTTLGAVCERITDGKHGDCIDEGDSGFYFLSAKNIKDGTLQFDAGRQITKDDFLETHRRTALEPGDILITNAGTIGRMAVAPRDPRTSRTTFQKSVAVLKPIRSVIDSRFAFYCLSSGLARFVALSAGAAQKNLLLRDLRSYSFMFPQNLKAQRDVAAVLDHLEFESNVLQSLFQRKLAALEALKKSLLHQAFTGQLTLALNPTFGVAGSRRLSVSYDAMPLESKHIDAFKRAESLLFHFDFCPYFELKKLMTDGRDENHRRFKALFCKFYTLNMGGLTDAFRDRYFAILFEGGAFTNERPNYESILKELSAIKRRKNDFAMPFSFVSKLVAMHDDRYPIYDRHVRSFFREPSPPASIEKEKRIEWFVSFLNRVRTSYETWSVDPRMTNVLGRLRNQDEQLAACSVVRQIDFLVWKVGNEKLLA